MGKISLPNEGNQTKLQEKQAKIAAADYLDNE